MAVNRTKYRIIYPLREMELVYKLKRENMPDSMEILPDGKNVASYLTEQQFLDRQGELFPRCPVTGAFCLWDTDWMKAYDLL